jgi:hypothetical protein
MLVEVMVGAVVLAIVTTALLNGIDGAQSQGTTNKARSTAAALAEQDQERLRALPVATLASCCTPPSRTVTVRGADYTVTSSVAWVTDQGGPVSCSNNSKTAANLRITSAVSSNATKATITEVSLVTPPPGTFSPGQGRGIVKVNKADGTPGVAVGVNLIGATTYSATTNSLGCAVFPFVDAGSYTASVGASSLLVDWQGVSPSTTALSVTAGTSTTTSVEMDTSAEIRAVFDTSVNGATAVAAKSQWLTLTNSKLTVGQKIFQGSPTGSPQTTVIAQTLFPFLDGYKAYAGQCSANNPALAPTNNSALLPTYTPTPGQILTMTTANAIRVPSVNVRIVTNANVLVSASPFATVIVKTNDSSCANVFPNQTSNTTGALPAPGFPYGTYKICAQRTVAGTTTHGRADVYNGGYDTLNSGTGAAVAETAANKVDDTVLNTTAAGNPTNTTTNGAIQIKLNRTGICT